MPRHRRERVPRHRAQRIAGNPARRVPLSAARTEPETAPPVGAALGVAELDGSTELDGSAETAPLPVQIGALLPRPRSELWSPPGDAAPDAVAPEDWPPDNGAPGHARPSGHARPRRSRAGGTATSSPSDEKSGGKQPGVARGLLLTPWFAAASGFVIAASLSIYSPHPQFAFPDAVGKVPCTPDGCGSHTDQQGAGGLAIGSGQQVTPHRKSGTHAGADARHRTSTAISGLTFGYFVRPGPRGNSRLIISITSKRVIKNWTLAFVLPGDHIQSVSGVHWKVLGSDRVFASPLTGGRGQQGGGAGAQGWDQGDHGYNYGHGGYDQPGFISFTVFVSGATPVPTHCSFDGASCTFHKSAGH